MTLRVAILGSGNIGTDLMYKVIRNPALELAGVAGADPASEGLARARALGISTTDRGVGPFLARHPEVAVAFDATSAHAHVQHAPLLAARGIRCIDLTPAALGPAVVPDVNLDENLGAPDTNLVTCGAQATVPVVAALSALGPVNYAEIVSTVASRSAGPGTRSNIDEFTIATGRSLETIGGARGGMPRLPQAMRISGGSGPWIAEVCSSARLRSAQRPFFPRALSPKQRRSSQRPFPAPGTKRTAIFSPRRSAAPPAPR